MRALALLWLVSTGAVAADPWAIEPPPRGRWSLDQTGRISQATLASLDAIATALDASGAGQLGVLVVNSTSGLKPRDFATGVFNSWGVGHHGTNDGVLLFVALGDRKAEIVLGEGSRIATSQTDAVMRDDVVANFKAGRVEDGLTRAAASLAQLARTAAGQPAGAHEADNTGLGPDAYVTLAAPDSPHSDETLLPYLLGEASFPERSPRTWVVDLSDVLTPSQRAQLDVAASDIYAAGTGRIFFLVVKGAAPYPDAERLGARLLQQIGPLAATPAAVVAVDVGQGTGSIRLDFERLNLWELEQHAKAEAELARTLSVDRVAALLAAQRFTQLALERRIPPRPMGDVLRAGFERHRQVFQGGGVGLLVVGAFVLKAWNRRRVRTCKHCSQPRVRLGEDADDGHLSAGQQTEERLGSVDYDVWWCERCRDPLVLRYGAFFSSYSGCDSCGAKALRSTTTTLERATEYSGGRERVDRSCAHCSFKDSFTRSTPRIQRSRSSSSSSSWSSSSSSRSSFGGGSSSGRGSSGSW